MSVNTEQHINGVTPPAPKKASRLKAKDPKEAEPKKPTIGIFGGPGVGKTWTSLDFPTTYYLDAEGGATRDQYTDKIKRVHGVYMGPEDGAADPKTILEQIDALSTEEHGYKTLVIDSISKVFNTMISNEAERLGDKDGFGASKKPAIAWIRRLIGKLSRLDMNVILVCHEKPVWGPDGAGQIGVTYDCWDRLGYELDLVLHITKQGASRYALPVKSRLIGFPEGKKFDWSYEEFAGRYGRDVMEQTAKPITLANETQVARIKLLLEAVKISEDEIGKWFSKANVTDWAEMTTETIEKCIAFLQQKVTGV